MPREILKYTNNEVTVVWQPKLCIHSAICFKGLPEVFDPKASPWVKINGTAANRIIDQVSRCPSGALRVESGDEPTPLDTGAGEDAKLQPLTIQIMKNGPALIKETCLVQLPNGKEEVRESVVALCRCGASGNKPYCDGTHNKIRFEG